MCQAIKRIRISSVLYFHSAAAGLSSLQLPPPSRYSILVEKGAIVDVEQKYYDKAKQQKQSRKKESIFVCDLPSTAWWRGKKLYFFTIIADILFGYCVLAG